MTQRDGDTFKLVDADSYNNVVDQFEELTRRYTTHIAQRLLEFANARNSDAVLDVGCGTGVLSLSLAGHSDSRPNSVIGLDLSAQMLQLASAAAAALPQPQIVQFRQGDAENLPFADRQFDCIVSLYALRHFPDPQRAVREMMRVARPGALVCIGVGSAPSLLSVAGARAVARRIGDRFAALRGRAVLCATESLDSFLRARGDNPAADGHAGWTQGRKHYAASVATLLRSAGMEAITQRWYGHQEQITDPEHFWMLQATLSSFARKHLNAMATSQYERLRDEYCRYCHAVMQSGGALVYRSGALVTRARVPGGTANP
ncbi:MAG: class I SAM-dependent methyltransferase [Steroidobacteraceae bacterium]